jgi:hypothetical protein
LTMPPLPCPTHSAGVNGETGNTVTMAEGAGHAIGSTGLPTPPESSPAGNSSPSLARPAGPSTSTATPVPSGAGMPRVYTFDWRIRSPPANNRPAGMSLARADSQQCSLLVSTINPAKHFVTPAQLQHTACNPHVCMHERSEQFLVGPCKVSCMHLTNQNFAGLLRM